MFLNDFLYTIYLEQEVPPMTIFYYEILALINKNH
ncbi:hypothetical protein CHY_2256 [Carboxydothermus hydrogenoformans Z-2901]|uniref:Uncharacterized protein n=1 Tax=Carboxydothermus hydrogenoformans (strain ATCC BAA-161 / DSM 6008 / Z-2901) TaxID=246194 RepID=Q3A9W9_CARHZ|nr:hypothetical protein CHY_2256 [Carboxydothermus hydrogenoformans Z-2901]